MTKNELINEVARQSGVRRVDVDAVLTATDNVIHDRVLLIGEQVHIGLGVWKHKVTKQRNGRNPQTGASMVIPSKTTLIFKAKKR